MLQFNYAEIVEDVFDGLADGLAEDKPWTDYLWDAGKAALPEVGRGAGQLISSKIGGSSSKKPEVTSSSSGGGSSTMTYVAIGAGVIGVGGLLWWLLRRRG